MVFKSKIKWIALFVFVLSFASLLRHLSIARSSTVDLVQYSAQAGFRDDFSSTSQVGIASIFVHMLLFPIYGLGYLMG